MQIFVLKTNHLKYNDVFKTTTLILGDIIGVEGGNCLPTQSKAKKQFLKKLYHTVKALRPLPLPKLIRTEKYTSEF